MNNLSQKDYSLANPSLRAVKQEIVTDYPWLDLQRVNVFLLAYSKKNKYLSDSELINILSRELGVDRKQAIMIFDALIHQGLIIEEKEYVRIFIEP